ncbi:hypothetical protein JAAARDRAFT_191563 [Jaapia argillacea MUCL 33604]|uniref:F-box domain-containing protein n=1 Tax=Jaapia argillacea MUCL 33604 TaxID=933084 RepID=A0A067PZM1_9AGAM|nr:hypothetical protein JAAARDRAFT_191563 [Jaapia argillacea MUCL 33604]
MAEPGYRCCYDLEAKNMDQGMSILYLGVEDSGPKDSLVSASGFTPVFKQPPPEILQSIFNFAIPSPSVLDPSLSFGEMSVWSQTLRDKKSIVMVCKAWLDVGLEYLYEDIVLRRITQIPPLVWTLHITRPDFGAFVKGLNVICVVPDAFRSLFETGMKCILSRCPRLINVSLRFTSLPSPYKSPDPPLSWIGSAPGSVEGIGLNEQLAFSPSIATHLSTSEALVSLTITLPAYPSTCDSPFRTFLSFHRLEYFQCAVDRRTAIELANVSKHWSLPRLRGVTFELTSCGPWVNTEPFSTFCGTYSHLQYLHIWPYLLYTGNLFDVQPVIARCPNLQHLIFPLESKFPVEHPALMYIDVWLPAAHKAVVLPSPLVVSGSFPALRCTRTLDRSLNPFSQLPMLFRPQEGVGSISENRIHHLPGVIVRETLSTIVQLRDLSNAEDSEDSDESYEWTASESETDGSSSDDGEEAIEECHEEDELGLEAGLARFHELSSQDTEFEK